MTIGCVCVLPRISESLLASQRGEGSGTYTVCAELAKVVHASGLAEELILAVPSNLPSYSKDRLGSLAYLKLHETTLTSQADILSCVVEQTNFSDVAIVDTPTVLLPVTTVTELVQNYHEVSGKVRWIEGLPDELTPFIYATPLLKGLIQALRASGVAARVKPFTRRYCSPAKEKGKSGTPPVNTAGLSITRLSECGYIPERLDSAEPLFSERLEHSIHQAALDRTGSPFARLRSWKKQMLRETDELVAELRRTSRGASNTAQGRLHVVMVQTPSAYSGSEEAIVPVLASLKSLNIQVSVVTTQEGTFTKALEQRGISVEITKRTMGQLDEEPLIRMDLILRRLQPNIVHLNSCVDRVPALTAALLGIPVVVHARLHPALLTTHNMKYADRIVAVSERAARVLHRLDVDPDKVQVLYDGADPAKYRAREMRHSRREGADPPTVLCVARFERYKRHDLLIEAFVQVRQSYPDARLLLVGEVYSERDAITEREVRSAITQRKLTESVSFLPFVENLSATYKRADLLVLCSDDEPFGMCVMEAMRVGLPTVVTYGCGVAEVLTSETDSLLVPSDNSAALAEAICKTLQQRERTLDRVQRAFVTASHFSPEQTARQLAQMYGAMVSRASAPVNPAYLPVLASTS